MITGGGILRELLANPQLRVRLESRNGPPLLITIGEILESIKKYSCIT
jgi:hypothetical protein